MTGSMSSSTTGCAGRAAKCGSSNIKFGVHDQAHSGFELSVTCGDCHHFDKGANTGADAERMVMGWHTAT